MVLFTLVPRELQLKKENTTTSGNAFNSLTSKTLHIGIQS